MNVIGVVLSVFLLGTAGAQNLPPKAKGPAVIPAEAQDSTEPVQTPPVVAVQEESATPSAEESTPVSAGSSSGQAAEQVTESETNGTENSAAVSESTESTQSQESAQQDVVVPETPSMACLPMYLHWLRSQPAAVQNKNMDAYFFAEDYHGYNSVKQDEFAWREQQPKYIQKYQELLTSKPGQFMLRSYVQLGKYDFKKKGFPITIVTDAQEVLKDFYVPSGNMFGSFVVGGPKTGGEYICSGDEKTGFPTGLNVSLFKSKGNKFVSVPEAEAKEITAALGGNRKVYAEYVVTLKGLKTKPGVFDKKAVFYDVKVNVEKAWVHLNNKQYEFGF